MKLKLVYFTLLAIVFILDPVSAHAWGPGTHLDIALTILQHSVWAMPAIRALIESFPEEYIYGSVSPDIINGKKYAGAIHHCHNWSIGKLILEEASTDMERAAAWGYLTHLAADCVAHNYFVPFKMIESFRHRSLSHIYWEMRFDLHVPDKCWREIKKVIRNDYTPFDHLLEKVLKKTLFSFRTNKRLFNSILILQKMKQLRFGLKTYAKVSRWQFNPKEVKDYHQLMMETVKDFLAHPEKARCLKAEPSGMRKLAYASEMRKHLRSARRKVSAKKIDQFVALIHDRLKKGVFDPTVQLPGIQELLQKV